MKYKDKQVIILGGGCGALWLLHELSRKNYPCLLIDHNELGYYASTRNQSWLHSGALYSVIIGENEAASELGGPTDTSQNQGLESTARECWKAFAELQAFCPHAFEKDSECLFLFKTEKEAHGAFARVHSLGVRAEVLGRDGIEGKEPILSPATSLPFGLVTEDIPFDSWRILTGLAEAGAAYGGEFHLSSMDLRGLKISFHNDLWQVRDDKVTVVAPIVISATGTLIPAMFQHISIRRSEAHAWIFQKCLVAVLHQRICHRIIAMRSRQAKYLNLVPFEGGTTMNMGGSDKQVTEVDDVHFDVSVYRNMAEILTEFVPGILRSMPCETHFYTCQKLRNTDTSSHPLWMCGARHYFWIEGDENFFYFYPGKFTLAPLGAKALVKFLVENKRPGRAGSPLLSRKDPPAVARRPYYARATHVTGISDIGELMFEKKKG